MINEVDFIPHVPSRLLRENIIDSFGELGIMGNRLIIIVSVLFVLYSGIGVFSSVEESNLYKTLLSNYDKNVLPRINKDQKINLSVTLVLRSFQGFDERNGILTTAGLAWTQWDDIYLRWNPYLYGNITVLLMDRNDIWSPKLTLANPATELESIGEIGQTYVTFIGSVIWEFGHMFYSTCDIDVTFFPFDTQNCFLDFGPFGMKPDDWTLNSQQVNKSIYLENNIWVLTETFVETIKVADRWGARFWFRLQRRYTFYILNLFSPVLILVYPNTMVYVLTADSGERVGHAITCLLSLSVYMTFASEGLPDASKPLPIITIVLLTYVAISALISMTTIIGLRFHLNDNSHPPSRIFTKILCFWRKSFCVKAKVEDLSETESEETNDIEEEGIIISWKDIANQFDKLCFISSNVCILLITTVYFVIVRIYA